METNGLTTEQIIAVITSAATLIQIALLAYQALKRGKPEIKKLDAEGDSEIVEAAHQNVETAGLNITMLKERINELKKEVEDEKLARQQDVQYFKRRIKEIDREVRDYRMWAARLAKQVIEAGKTPVPFISSLNDSDPVISAITREQEQLEAEKKARHEEIKDTLDKEAG